MSKVYINARFLTQNITGVQRFAIELSKAILSIRNDVVLLVPSLDMVVDKSLLENLMVQEVKGGSGHFWEQLTLVQYLKSIGSPLLVNLCNTAPVRYKNKISMLHDIAFIRYPQSFSWKFRILYRVLFPLILKTSKKNLTGSMFAASDLSSIYNINANDFEIINSSFSDCFRTTDLQRLSLDKYALTVSSPNLHKNFARMIEAFLLSDVNLELKIIGSLSESFNDHFGYLKMDPRIKFLGRVSDEELINVYQNADFFIFPSLYEGFGIPPLEAQACGCPVISSNAASLPEVLEDSVLYFDPYDIDDIRNCIERIATNEDLKKTLIEKGLQNLERFSWHKSASKLNAIINDLIKK